MTVQVRIEGATVADKTLRDIEFAARRRVVSAAVRAGNAVIIREARNLAPVRTGNLRRQIRGTVKMDRVSGRVYGYVRARATKAQRTKGVQSAARYAHLVVAGTKPHEIPARPRGAMQLPGGFFTRVMHPGARPRPFMEQAASNVFSDAVRAFDFKFSERLIVEINKARAKNAAAGQLAAIKARF